MTTLFKSFNAKDRRYLTFALLLAFCLLARLPGEAKKSSSRPADPADSQSTAVAAVPDLTTDQIVDRMMDANDRRARALRSYTGRRSYDLVYSGFPGHKEASLVVMSQFVAPGVKEFTVVSESGSRVMINRVLKKLIDSEKEAADPENQRQTALTPENYRFELLGSREGINGTCYRLHVEPRRENKFLYRGEICVNGSDFAVESIDAEPAKNPSFWISNTHIEHRYAKVQEFWLPALNKSVTKVRMGGTATLEIKYLDYEVNPGVPQKDGD